MFVKEPEIFYNRVQHALNLPITTRCAELTVLLDRASPTDIQSVFPFLVDSIFGPQGGLSWGLRTTPENLGEDFRQLHHFLSPCGPFLKSIYTLLKDPNTKYDFPLSYLPAKVRQVLENASHPFYSDLIQVNSQTRQIFCLKLNPFDYYIFHFAYYLINPWHQRTSSAINYSWSTVYYVLCCDYITHFLPTDPGCPVLPNIDYNGKNPFQPIQQTHRPVISSPLLSPHLLNKQIEDYSYHQNLERHPRNEIWRSETVLIVFIDMWLNNDQIRQPVQTMNNTYNNPQAMQLLHYNELPTGEYMRIVRVFIKQIHAFSTSAKADDTHMGELKKITIPMVQGKFYIFIRNLIHRWPLDGSFRLVLELWLTYIQPWRYPPHVINKHLNPKPQNPDLEDMGLLTQTGTVERDQLSFIVDNLLAYVVIFQQLLPRFSRVDLVSPRMAIMLYRISKVFDQPNLTSLLREVERCVENSNSPSHTYNSHWSNILPPLSPTSCWSTNTTKANATNFAIENPGKQLFAPEVNNTSAMCGNYLHGDKKWTCIVRQRIYELEGPNFCYKPLFTSPPANEVFEVIHHLKRSIAVAQDIINVKQQEQAKQHAGIWGFVKSLFERSSSNDEFTLNERMKVPAYLDFSLLNLIDIFQIDEIQEKEMDDCSCPNTSSFDVSEDFKFLTPSRVKERAKKLKYEGDPDLQPIMSTENTFLVRILYQLAAKINEQYGTRFNRLYSNPSFKGRLTRQFLCEPITIFSFDKSKIGYPRVAKRLPPRVSLRQMASYKFLVYFAMGYAIALILGYNFTGYVIVLALIFVLYKCIKAIPKRHMYPTEGFRNIIFNDSF